jgi:hypothetical protein
MSEIKLAMCQILRKVQILPSLDSEYKPKVMAQVVLRSENGIRMRFAVSSRRFRAQAALFHACLVCCM